APRADAGALRRRPRPDRHSAGRDRGGCGHGLPGCAGTHLARPSFGDEVVVTLREKPRIGTVASIEFGRTVRVLRLRRLTARFGVRSVVVSAVLLVAACVVSLLALGTGDFDIPPDRVLRALLGSGVGTDELVVLEWRFPRVLMALV